MAFSRCAPGACNCSCVTCGLSLLLVVPRPPVAGRCCSSTAVIAPGWLAQQRTRNTAGYRRRKQISRNNERNVTLLLSARPDSGKSPSPLCATQRTAEEAGLRQSLSRAPPGAMFVVRACPVRHGVLCMRQARGCPSLRACACACACVHIACMLVRACTCLCLRAIKSVFSKKKISVAKRQKRVFHRRPFSPSLAIGDAPAQARTLQGAAEPWFVQPPQRAAR